MKTTKKPGFDRYIICTASAAVFGDVLTTVMIAQGGCRILIGALLWAVVTASFVAIVLLPAIVRWLFVAPLSPLVVRVLLGALLATAIPAVLASIYDDPKPGHCIS